MFKGVANGGALIYIIIYYDLTVLFLSVILKSSYVCLITGIDGKDGDSYVSNITHTS